MKKIPLSFSGKAGFIGLNDSRNTEGFADEFMDSSSASTNYQNKKNKLKTPFTGYCAIGFGLLGIFTIGFIFVPLGFICSIAAFFVGQPILGLAGLILAVAGFMTSPKLWLIIGMGALYAIVDLNVLTEFIFEFFRSIGRMSNIIEV